MIEFNIVGTVTDDLTTQLQGLSDIEVVDVNGTFVLVVASEADSAITTFDFSVGALPTLSDSQSYTNASGTRTVWDLTFAAVGNTTILLPATRYEDDTALYTLASDGTLSDPSSAAQTGVTGEGLGLSEAVTTASGTYVFVQRYGGQSLMVYRLGADLSLTGVEEIIDTPNTYLGDISAMASLRIGSQDFLFVASAYDAGLTSYSIGSDGTLQLADWVEPGDGSGFALAQALTAVNVGGSSYLVMASAGTSSLTVYSVDINGQMVETDHLLDTLDTRFQGASLIEHFSFEGNEFLVVAGSDDGITVLQLLPDGTLVVVDTLADTYNITLDNVSGLAVQVINGTPVLFVSSETEHGFTQIELDIEVPPVPGAEPPKDEDQVIDGTSASDTLNGGNSSDVIRGFGKADILVDGPGSDILRGGGGADTFCFVEDGAPDRIEDFNPQIDVIDLSLFAGINSLNDINIISLPEQIVIEVNQEIIILENSGPTILSLSDFGAEQFIF